jgi:hypothetical protein
MGFNDKLISFLTPKNTEEVKPNLFIQQTRGESIMSRLDKIVKGHQLHIIPDKYRQITPVAWDNKIINHTALWFGANPIKSTLVFLLILFIAWSYVHDINARDEFHEQVIYNKTFQNNLCELYIKENLTQVYNFNISYFCNNQLNVYRIETNITRGFIFNGN